MKSPLKFLKGLKLRQKLILSYAVVGIIPLLVLGSYSYYVSRSYMVQLEHRNLSENVDKISSNLNYKFNRFNSVMEFITMNPRFTEIFNKTYTDMFLLYKDVSDVVVPTLNTIQGLDSDIMDLAVCTDNDFPELSGSIRRLENAQKEFWIDLPVDFTGTSWYTQDGRLVGIRRLMSYYKGGYDSVFYIELDYGHMFNDISLEKLQQYQALLVDESGRTVYLADNLTDQQVRFTGEEHTAPGSNVVISGGERYLKLEEEIPAAKWRLYFYIPVKSVAIGAEKMVLTIFLIIGLCLLALMAVVWGFSSAFLKRIDDLNRKLKIVEEGNLKIEIKSDARDEIGDLVNGAGSMLKSINQLMDEVYHRELKQKEAEIKLLQSQINPHFLYNSLSMVNWKAIRIKANDISYIITTLSKYYRTTLNKGKNFTTVRDETDNIISYINIQLMMHNERFDAEYHIDESIAGFYMPNLTLQPIVENAIEHGIDKKEEGRGRIIITAEHTENAIRFCVEDNGPGMSEESLSHALTHQSRGYGIKNVNDRIKLIFGKEYGLHLKSTAGCGTRVEVLIPVREYPPDEPAGIE